MVPHKFGEINIFIKDTTSHITSTQYTFHFY